MIAHQARPVKEALAGRPVEFVHQVGEGTAYAVFQTEWSLQGVDETGLVLGGDTPLLPDEIVLKLFEVYSSTCAVASLLTAEVEKATGYGQILRDQRGGATGCGGLWPGPPQVNKESRAEAICRKQQSRVESRGWREKSRVPRHESRAEVALSDGPSREGARAG